MQPRVTQAEKNKGLAPRFANPLPEKLKAQREGQLLRKESQLSKLSDEEVVADLKKQGLPTFGTRQEKLDRLKKYYGTPPTPNPHIHPPPPCAGVLSQKNLLEEKEPVVAVTPTNNQPAPLSQANAAAKLEQGKKPVPRSNVLDEIEKLKKNRDERRQKMEHLKKEKAEKEAEVQAQGRNIDVDFELMMNKHRFREGFLQPHVSAAHLKLCVCVRKRPILKKEEAAGEIDSVSCANPQIKVLEAKLKVDGITKFVDDHGFVFDNTFNEAESNDDLYRFTLSPLLDLLFSGGVVTCFAYGQTGSGKTHTMVIY